MIRAGRPLRVALVAAALAAAACTPARPGPAPVLSGEAVVADRLFLGRAIPGGGTVSEQDWRAFLAEVVTPRFPEGLTVWRGEGQWRSPAGEIVREEVFVLELFHPGGADVERAVAEIAAEYRRRFRQESVLRVTSDARWRFLDR